jgi:hypothetical protein
MLFHATLNARSLAALWTNPYWAMDVPWWKKNTTGCVGTVFRVPRRGFQNEVVVLGSEACGEEARCGCNGDRVATALEGGS